MTPIAQVRPGETIGFIGLGQMGAPMAANIVAAGFDVLGFDLAGTAERLPAAARAAGSVRELGTQVETVLLSVPDGGASKAIATDIAAAPGSIKVVIDLSTIGPQAARTAAATLAGAGLCYIDVPVSGGRSGALARTISLMFAGPKAQFDRLRPLLASFSGNAFHVGEQAGQGQALKLLNNFLSGTAMAATAEAVLFGLSQGLEMKTILDVVAVSSGQNTAVTDKYPKRVLTGTYDAGFQTALLNKDVQLYLDHVREAGTPSQVGHQIASLWAACAAAQPPGSDFTRVYEFIRDQKPAAA
ncbi:MAG: NAD(P)-dependent oxidoreductase [Burkholderiaceae bacterium]